MCEIMRIKESIGILFRGYSQILKVINLFYLISIHSRLHFQIDFHNSIWTSHNSLESMEINLPFFFLDGEEEHWKFTMRFLGAVEVQSSSGDFALCQAINKVAQQGKIKSCSLCTLEINQYGIRMIDKSKEGVRGIFFFSWFIFMLLQ